MKTPFASKRLALALGMAMTGLLVACTPPGDGGVEQGADSEAPAAITDTEAADTTPMSEPVAADAETGMDVMAYDKAATKGADGTLVIGQAQEPDVLYTHGATMLASTHVLNSLYDGPIEGLSYDYQAVTVKALPKIENNDGSASLAMVSVDAGGKYVDATTQEVTTATATVADLGQLTVRWTFVDGLMWQDGTPVTAEDSVWSKTLACDIDSPTSKFLCDRTVSYKAIDDHTVEWVSLPGYTPQDYFTNVYTPLPRHQPGAGGKAMSEMTAKEILEDNEFNRKPWSYGPFMIEEWSDGDYIKLTRNPNYWRAAEGLPILDTVIHKFIKDSNALLAALRTGDIDVATQDGLDITMFDDLEAANTGGEATPYYVPGTVWEHIDFNLQPLDDRPAFGACKDVRLAIAYGTDRATMADEIQKGKTTVADTIMPAEHWAYPPEGMLTSYPYDSEKAIEMLEAAGFTDPDGDGTRTAAQDITCSVVTGVDGATTDKVIKAGTPLELKLNTTKGNVMREETTLLFQQNMTDIGVKVSLEYLPADTLFAKNEEGPLTGRRYDLGEFAWVSGVSPSVGLYWCDQIPSPENNWAGQNNPGYCNPNYDKVSKTADNTLERDEALPMYHEAQKIFSDELPVLPLFARVKVMATKPEVMNFMPNATVSSETWNIETWGFAAAP
ncbi:MAG: peptide ABC transporter substrate-binding protein [Ardenticatenales bacterium]|nr:peptide ABC transporter substrate-binding protein [Ardenticatenales bacterium]